MTIKLLCFSTLYPNAGAPSHGVFVENRLRRLVETDEVDAQVLAPVPWFPSSHAMFGQYAHFAKAPRFEVRHGITLHHPRYLVIPKLGMRVTPHFLARASIAAARQIISSGFEFDAIDAHYFYPDGIAAMALAQTFDKPFMVTARGTDINLIPAIDHARASVLEVAEKAEALGAVCQALGDEMVELGMSAGKLHVLRNGVDLEVFHPAAREDAKAKWDVTGPALVSVGALSDRKGQDLIITAMQELPDYMLLLAGGGSERACFEALTHRLGVADRVRFLGSVPHEALASLFSACEISILASSREGWANVLLESMACGTPVVATNVWGTPEVVADPAAGVLMRDRSAEAIVEGVKVLAGNMPNRAATRAYAERFSWADTTQRQLEIFAKMTGKRRNSNGR